MTTEILDITYTPEVIERAYDRAFARLGDTWRNALSTGRGWLSAQPRCLELGSTSHLVRSLDSGTTYTVALDGSSCTCPSYMQPALAGAADKARPCKHRGLVILYIECGAVEEEDTEAREAREARQRTLAAYRATFSEALLPYVPGVAYVPGAWEGTEHAEAERARLGDGVVDAAVWEMRARGDGPTTEQRAADEREHREYNAERILREKGLIR